MGVMIYPGDKDKFKGISLNIVFTAAGAGQRIDTDHNIFEDIIWVADSGSVNLTRTMGFVCK